MYIEKIRLKNFRNYRELFIEFHKKVNMIIGKNAQGKTNLIEAIYISSVGKSFRTSKDAEMINFGSDFLRVDTEAVKGSEDLQVELVISKEGKAAKINGGRIKKNSELLDNIYTVIFSPEDLKIVKDEPEKRRRFVDRELCQLSPLYYNKLSEYKKILKQRNTYLKERDIDKGIMDVWDTGLAATGSFIMLRRRNFIKNLRKISNNIHNNITRGKEELEINYESNIHIPENEEKLAEYFKDILYSNFQNDIKNRNTGKGPHKDDLKLSVNGIDIRHFGSQGQQRTAALSLKLAELKLIKEETGEDAVLLLDDVLSELDNERQEFLINSLGDVQLFITTTELSENLKKSLSEGKIFIVERGMAREEL